MTRCDRCCFGFFVSAVGSALFGVLAVEARPLQWFVWMATLGAPLLLLGGAFHRLPHRLAPILSRYLIFVLWLQVPFVSLPAQLVRHGEPEPGRLVRQLVGDANLVGIWGPRHCRFARCVCELGRRHRKGGAHGSSGCNHFAAAAFLVGARARKSIPGPFSVPPLSSRRCFSSRGYRHLPNRHLVSSGCGVVALLLTGVLAESWVGTTSEGVHVGWENSRTSPAGARGLRCRATIIPSLGVGPGMLGSRAAAPLPADVLPRRPAVRFQTCWGLLEARALGHVRIVGRGGGKGRHR